MSSGQPKSIQLGNFNTQYNYYLSDNYGSPGGSAKPEDCGPFQLATRLALSSPNKSLADNFREEMSKRASRTTYDPLGDLLICRRLAALVAERGDWQLRR